jgi:class 3 adenylate cyclase
VERKLASHLAAVAFDVGHHRASRIIDELIAQHNGPVSGSAGDSVIADFASEVTFWNTIKDSGDAEMFKGYLEKYPEGEFRRLAEISLAKLSDEQSPTGHDA